MKDYSRKYSNSIPNSLSFRFDLFEEKENKIEELKRKFNYFISKYIKN